MVGRRLLGRARAHEAAEQARRPGPPSPPAPRASPLQRPRRPRPAAAAAAAARPPSSRRASAASRATSARRGGRGGCGGVGWGRVAAARPGFQRCRAPPRPVHPLRSLRHQPNLRPPTHPPTHPPRFESHIWEAKKQIYLGGFDSEALAAKAHGELAAWLPGWAGWRCERAGPRTHRARRPHPARPSRRLRAGTRSTQLRCPHPRPAAHPRPQT